MEYIGLIDKYTDGNYKSIYEYYIRKVKSLDLDEILKRAPKFQNELFAPEHFIMYNEEHII